MAGKKKIKTYENFSEVLLPREAAELVKVSLPKFWEWVHGGLTPMGEIKEGVHYFKVGPEYRIIKDRLCELFGILPKGLVKEEVS